MYYRVIGPVLLSDGDVFWRYVELDGVWSRGILGYIEIYCRHYAHYRSRGLRLPSSTHRSPTWSIGGSVMLEGAVQVEEAQVEEAKVAVGKQYRKAHLIYLQEFHDHCEL